MFGLAFVQAVYDDGAPQPWLIGLTGDLAEWDQNESFHLYVQILLENTWAPLHSGGDGILQILPVLGQLAVWSLKWTKTSAAGILGDTITQSVTQIGTRAKT